MTLADEYRAKALKADSVAEQINDPQLRQLYRGWRTFAEQTERLEREEPPSTAL